MAADLPLPKRIFAHGWLLFGKRQDEQIARQHCPRRTDTPGNGLRSPPLLPVPLEIVFGQDGGFSYEALVTRYNAELANGLGNLGSRTLTMIRQYRDGVIPVAVCPTCLKIQ